MATVYQCSLLPSNIYEQWVRPPYEEARLQFAYAIFQDKASTGEATSLAERVVHLVTAALLTIPIVHWVLYLAMQHFDWTIGGRFQEAITSGDARLVAFYLNIGIDPKQLEDNILYRTDNEDIIRSLLSHGILPDDRYPEYLIDNGKESFLRALISEKHIDIEDFLTEELFLHARATGNDALLTFMIEMGYEGTEDNFVGLDLQVGDARSFARAAFNHDVHFIESQAKAQSFQEFCEDYQALKTAFPHINTDWMWSVLFTIPHTHYTSFRDIGNADEVKGKPPREPSLLTLTELFDRINFDDPNAPNYIPEARRKETFNEHTHTRSVQYLREGLVNIREKITDSKRDETGASDEEMANHKHYLDWVLYYLDLNELANSVAPLDETKANVLIDLGKAGQVCAGRYKELFCECRRRLTGEKQKELTFEEQVMVRLGDLRSIIVYEIVHREAHGCTHARDNLLFHLKEPRGLPGDKPFAPFAPEVGGIEFTTLPLARAAFDPHYTPAREIAHINELISARGQEASDFNNLVMDYMSAQFAPQLQHQKLLRMRAGLAADLDRQLSYEEIDALFQRYDSDYVVRREGVDIPTFFDRLANDEAFVPFRNAFILPDARVMQRAFTDRIAEKKRLYDDLLKIFMTPSEGITYDEQMKILNGCDKEALTQQQDAALSTLGRLRMAARVNMQRASSDQLREAQTLLGLSSLPTGPQVMAQYLTLGREITSLESGQGSSEVIKRAFLDQAQGMVVKNNQTLRTFTQAVGWVIPNIDPNLLDKSLNDPHVKQLIAKYVADTIFNVAPKPIREYFKAYQNDVFMHLVRPVENPIPEGMQPLAVGVLLNRLGHLQWRNQEYFQFSFMSV